jgi:protein SCO1/2
MQLNRVLLALLALSLALSACGSYEFRGGVIEPPSDSPDFTLTNQSGQPFQLSEQRGQVVLLFFGFTNCPDVCPTALAEAAAARRQLGTDGEKLTVALITVDPERDTPERLGRYVRAFDPSFVGLSGTRAELEPIYKAYGVAATRRELPESALAYTIDHSAFLYVIDRDGQWRVAFTPGTPIEDMVSDLRHLIQTGVS